MFVETFGCGGGDGVGQRKVCCRLNSVAMEDKEEGDEEEEWGCY